MAHVRHPSANGGDDAHLHMPEIILASLSQATDREGANDTGEFVSRRGVQSSGAIIVASKETDNAVLLELRRVRRASCLARGLVACPWIALIVSVLCLAALSVVPFLRPPSVNVSFETLTVQSHAVNRAAAAADYIVTESDLYWTPAGSMGARRLRALPDRRFDGDPSDGAFGYHAFGYHADRQLLQSSGTYRSHVEYTLDVVYYQTTKATMLDPDVLEKIKAVEDEVYGLDLYRRLCIHQGSTSSPECRRPISFVNYVYGEVNSDDSFSPSGNAPEQQNATMMAQVLAVRGLTYFFDKDADFETGYTSTLRSAYIFGVPADGVNGPSASEDLYRKLCKELHGILMDARDGTFQITFGGEVMTDWEIEQQLFSDARFVSVAVAIAVVMLLIGTRSVVLTVFALLQILVSFPIAYTFYYAFGFSSIGLIQLLAPFVILGIGLDDVFVFTSVYRSMQAYAADFSIETRLTAAWKRSFGAILATSATSTIAFAANIISPLPAIRMFGYLLAILAAVNFLLVTTFAPVYVVLNERFCSCCSCSSSPSRRQDSHQSHKLAATSASKAVPAPQPIWNGERVDGSGESTAASTEGEEVDLPVAAPGRRLWALVFEGIWRGRAFFVLALLGVAAWGAYSAAQLESADSAPALFADDHNVQRYLDMNQANYTDSSLFSSACAGCFDADLALSAIDTLAIPVNAPASPITTDPLPPGVEASPESTFGTVPESDPTPSGTPFGSELSPPPPSPPSTPSEPTPSVDGSPSDAPPTESPPDESVPQTWPFLPGTWPYSPPPPLPEFSDAEQELPPPPPPSPWGDPGSDSTPSDEVATVEISSDALAAAAERSNRNTIRVDVLWGITGIIENENRDPFDKEALAQGLKYDEAFDLSQASTQLAVLQQVENLVHLTNGTAQEGKDDQVSSMLWDVLGTLRRWCIEEASDRSYCSQLDSQSGLPTGSAFDEAVFAMLSEGSLDVSKGGLVPANTGDARRSIGFEFSKNNANTAEATGIPKVRWVRYTFSSATSESASPADILDSYERWNDWADSISKEVPGAGKPVVAGEPWIIAVTEDVITRNTIWSIVLSSVCALISVYVFTGSLLVTIIALVTMTCVNVFTLGLFHVMGWSLGATEGVAITVLVGLSVDYCLHFSEAFVLSVLSSARARAKDSLMLMGTPVLSSAVSTILVSVPLALTETVALRKFAVVIAVSLGASYLYAVLMLLPLLGTVGPAKRPEGTALNWLQRFLSCGLRRAALASGLFLLLMVAVPQGRELLFDNYAIAIILAAIIVVATVTSVWRLCRRKVPEPEL